ncbi:Androgen-induced protein 1 [Gryllus bimaculatus]|nr:Androgen-induced protein 1 [Gryllus bimaculatus]
MSLPVNALAAAHFLFGIYYAMAFVAFPDGVMPDALRGIGWKKYLTFWNMCLQSLYFTICVLNDIAGSNEIAPKNPPLIRRIKDYMLCTVAFPVSMVCKHFLVLNIKTVSELVPDKSVLANLFQFVGLTFWGLYAIDRELVFPKALDPYFPSWLNHVMHTNIMIFIVLEMVLSFRKYPTRGNGTGGLTAFMCVYLVWTFIIYFYSGAWVYPVLEVLNWGQRAIFFIVLLLFVNALYFVGEFVNKTIWGKELRQLERAGSHKRSN